MTTTITKPKPTLELASTIVADAKAAQDAAHRSYRLLVVKAANGAKTDAKAAAAVLRDAGKDAGDLQVDVARLLERRECAAAMAAEENATRELSAIGLRQQTARQAYLDAKQAAEDAFTAAQRELNQLEIAQRRITDAASKARQRLQGELAPPELANRIESLRAELDRKRSFYQLTPTQADTEAIIRLESELHAALQETLIVE